MRTKKLVAGLLTGLMLASLAGAVPAQAGNKGLPVDVIHGGAPFDNHAGKPGGAPGTTGCDGKSKKNCAPWAYLAAGWPRLNAQPVANVGGHFHKWFADANGDLWDQEINLVDSNGKATQSIMYNEFSCAAGLASGTLPVHVREATPFNPLMKSHNEDIKDTDTHYEIAYVRLGNTAIILGLDNKKTAAIVAALVFHPKEVPADTANRCLGVTDSLAPLKVSFDVLGIYVDLD